MLYLSLDIKYHGQRKKSHSWVEPFAIAALINQISHRSYLIFFNFPYF